VCASSLGGGSPTCRAFGGLRRRHDGAASALEAAIVGARAARGHPRHRGGHRLGGAGRAPGHDPGAASGLHLVGRLVPELAHAVVGDAALDAVLRRGGAPQVAQVHSAGGDVAVDGHDARQLAQVQARRLLGRPRALHGDAVVLHVQRERVHRGGRRVPAAAFGFLRRISWGCAPFARLRFRRPSRRVLRRSFRGVLRRRLGGLRVFRRFGRLRGPPGRFRRTMRPGRVQGVPLGLRVAGDLGGTMSLGGGRGRGGAGCPGAPSVVFGGQGAGGRRRGGVGKGAAGLADGLGGHGDGGLGGGLDLNAFARFCSLGAVPRSVRAGTRRLRPGRGWGCLRGLARFRHRFRRGFRRWGIRMGLARFWSLLPKAVKNSVHEQKIDALSAIP